MTEPATSTRGFWIGFALGAPVVAAGLRGVVVDAAQTHPAELARWVAGVAVVHELVVAPVILAAGLLLRRGVSARHWPAVRWAVITSAVLTLVAWPFVRGYGRDPSIPSLLSRNYAAGLLALLAAVWAVATVVIAITVLRRHRRGDRNASLTKA